MQQTSYVEQARGFYFYNELQPALLQIADFSLFLRNGSGLITIACFTHAVAGYFFDFQSEETIIAGLVSTTTFLALDVVSRDFLEPAAQRVLQLLQIDQNERVEYGSDDYDSDE